jgi:hypothetical protein
MPATNSPKTRTPLCKPPGNLRAAGIAYLGTAAAFLAVAWLGHQPAFTGVGFAFAGIGLAWLLRGGDKR